MNARPSAARVPAPGRIIRREIEARGWTQKDLANIMGRPEKTISEIVNGHKQITADTALQLASAFGTSADLWLNLETNYRLHLARQQQDLTEVERKSRIYELAPVSEITRLGWIRKWNTVEDLEKAIKEFLSIDSLGERPAIAVNLRQSDSYSPELAAETAWLKRVEHLASAQAIPPYDRDRLLADIPVLLGSAERPEDVTAVPAFFLSHGVHFVIVPRLQQTYIDGAAFTLGQNPVVALTLRHHRIDNFWFTLLHELAHIVLEHSGGYLDNMEESQDNPTEIEANRWAQDLLIDPDELCAFLETTTAPYYSQNKVMAFAARLRRHPGIVVGRLQHDEIIPYQNLRNLLANVSSYLERWTDVADPDTPSESD
jgi:HTH-type transcriptional regulator / antitoxin HigA